MLESLTHKAAVADPVEFWIAICVAAGIAAFALYRALRAFSGLRLIADTPTARIRSAPQGHVELQGLAQPRGEPLPAPLSTRPCVWYRYRIAERRSSGRNESWVTVEQGEAEGPFLLDDGTGHCLVEPKGARLHCAHRETWYSGRRGGRPNESGDGWSGLLLGGRKRWRMSEERIQAGDFLYVLGHLETPRRDSREREQLARALLARWKADPQRLRRFDRNGDGEIDLEEWEAARAEAERLATEAEQRLAATPTLARIRAPGDRRLPFIIAADDERAMLSRLGLETLGLTLLALALTLGLILALLARLEPG